VVGLLERRTQIPGDEKQDKEPAPVDTDINVKDSANSKTTMHQTPPQLVADVPFVISMDGRTRDASFYLFLWYHTSPCKVFKRNLVAA
jgi:hypothetical protein